MDKFNVLYTESPVVQLLQIVVPGKVAPVSVRSLELQEVTGGNVVVVCAKACDENRHAGRKRTSKVLMIRFRFLQVKGWVITK
jgi:hypothetical protein